MKFGTGSNAERTQKYGGSKYKMTYIRPNINKQTSPIFNCVIPVSVSLARQLSLYHWLDNGLFSLFASHMYCRTQGENNILSMSERWSNCSKNFKLTREIDLSDTNYMLFHFTALEDM